MRTPFTVWEITCDGCGSYLNAPRAQDYWSDDEITSDLELRLEANEWAEMGDLGLRCPDCVRTIRERSAMT